MTTAFALARMGIAHPVVLCPASCYYDAPEDALFLTDSGVVRGAEAIAALDPTLATEDDVRALTRLLRAERPFWWPMPFVESWCTSSQNRAVRDSHRYIVVREATACSPSL